MKVSTEKRASHKPDFPTRDHIEPKSKTPGSEKTICCLRCNLDKKDMTLQEWYDILKNNNDIRAPIVRSRMLTRPHRGPINRVYKVGSGNSKSMLH